MLDFRKYLRFAEKYLMMAEDEEGEPSNVEWLLIPATVLAWASIESFVNNMLDDFSSLPEDLFELHERAFLLEKRIRFVDSGKSLGQFILEGSEYQRLDDKIFFLLGKFGLRSSIKGERLWQNFEDFKDVRDALLHPRRQREIVLTTETVSNYLEISKDIIRLVSKYVWNRDVDF